MKQKGYQHALHAMYNRSLFLLFVGSIQTLRGVEISHDNTFPFLDPQYQGYIPSTSYMDCLLPTTSEFEAAG
jgi:hypothetical protein